MQIVIAPDVKGVTTSEVQQFPPFKRFCDLNKGQPGVVIETVRIIDAVRPEAKIFSLDCKVHYQLNGKLINTHMVLRGDTVDVATVVTASGMRYAVLVKQFRPAVGAWVISNPAGFINVHEPDTPNKAALREVREETDTDDIAWSEPVNLSTATGQLAEAAWVSPGLCDERVHYMATFATISPERLAELKNAKGGLAQENEHTQVIVKPLGGVCSFLNEQPLADEKTMRSWSLFRSARK